MLIHINAAKCVGIDAVPVTVEVDVINGIGIHLVGLADVAVKESLLRTVTALQSMGFHIPGKKIVINLAPAHLPKSGSGYDVPIALGIIAASQQRDLPGLGRYIIMGELGLDGSVREVPGALPMVELAGKQGLSGAILPARSAMEAVENRDTLLFGVETLADVLAILEEKEDPAEMLIWNTPRFQQAQRQAQQQKAAPSYMDFADIIGQEGAKRAIEIAAAGGHNLMMVGAPGAGKSSLARALAGILPPMTTEEALQTSKIYSVAGKRSGEVFGLIRERPFRSPHYSASLPAIVGGGGGDNILPGEITLAHHGVLFLDELAQMPKATIEALRGPLEDRKVTISRLRMKLEYPASFMLVAASNPCPCGYYGEGDRCTCTAGQRTNYLSRLSGPIMDRIDIHLWLHPVDPKMLVHRGKGVRRESSAQVAARVAAARVLQRERFAGTGIFTNAEMSGKQVEQYCPLSDACRDQLETLMLRMGLSARAYTRILKLSRTIADLKAVSTGTPPGDICPEHLIEASSYRFLDRRDLLDP